MANILSEVLSEDNECEASIVKSTSLCLEEGIFESAEQNSNSKVYRDKMNTIRMQLKGSRNKAMRMALLDGSVKVDELIKGEGKVETKKEELMTG